MTRFSIGSLYIFMSATLFGFIGKMDILWMLWVAGGALMFMYFLGSKKKDPEEVILEPCVPRAREVLIPIALLYPACCMLVLVMALIGGFNYGYTFNMMNPDQIAAWCTSEYLYSTGHPAWNPMVMCGLPANGSLQDGALYNPLLAGLQLITPPDFKFEEKSGVSEHKISFVIGNAIAMWKTMVLGLVFMLSVVVCVNMLDIGSNPVFSHRIDTVVCVCFVLVILAAMIYSDYLMYWSRL